MATIGPLYVGTGANYNDGGTTAWTNPTNFQGDTTSTAATCSVGSNGGTSQKLRGSAFGFTQLGGATINGVTVEVEASSANNNRQYWNNVQLLVAGTEAGDNKSDGAAINTTKAFKTFGGSADGWNASLDGAKVMASGFGISVKISRSSTSTTTTSMFRARITITYTPAGFAVAAVIAGTQSGSTSVAAVLGKSQSGSFPIEAVRHEVVQGGILLDAIQSKTLEPPGIPLDGVIHREQPGSFPVDAVVFSVIDGSFPVQYQWTGNIQTIEGDFPVEAVIGRTAAGSFAVDAIRQKTISTSGAGVFDGGVFDAGVFDAGGGSGIILAAQIDAGLVTHESSFKADAVLQRTINPSFPADAVQTRTIDSGWTVDAVQARTIDSGWAVDAIQTRTIEPAGFPVQAEKTALVTHTGDFPVEAVLWGTIESGWGVAAVLSATTASSFPVEYQWSTVVTYSGDFKADAVLWKTIIPVGWPADAVLTKTIDTPTFPVAAYIRGRIYGSFPVNAIRRRVISSNFPTRAVKQKTILKTFLIRALKEWTVEGSFPVQYRWERGFFIAAQIDQTYRKLFNVAANLAWRSFPVAATIKATRTSSFGIAAEKIPYGATRISASSYLDALILGPIASSFPIDAVIRVAGGSFALEADIKGQNEQRGLFDMSAVLGQRTTSTFALNGQIGGNGFFWLGAILKGQPSSFVLDAYIVLGSGSGSFAIAAVKKQTFETINPGYQLVWFDDFNRTVAEGYGPDYTEVWYGGAVDGDAATTIGLGPSGEYSGGYDWPGGIAPAAVRIQFDFLITSLTNTYPQYEIWPSTSLDFGVRADSGTVWRYTLYGSSIYNTFSPTVGEWWTAKAEAPEGIGGPRRAKVWKRGEAEPDWGLTGTSVDTAGPDYNIEVDSGAVSKSRLDNLYVWDMSVLVGGTAPILAAIIADANGAFPDHPGSFAVDAHILAAGSGSFPVAAEIVPRGGSFWIDAVLWKAGAAGFAIDAYIRADNIVIYPEDGIGTITVISGGSGYTDTPTVVFGGPGEGAVAVPIVTGGVITGFVILNGGSGYTESSTVTISGGGGAGADIEPIVSGGMVVGFVVISGGSGYTAGPTASVTDPTGSGASAVTVVSGGEVTAIVVTNPGSGYTSPSVDVTGPATASATTSNLIGPIGPSGNILPAGYAASRKYRIEITVGGTEVTGDVIWSRTSFTQYAKTGPGTFEIVLNGAFTFTGGEEVTVDIDGIRTFGGYVIQIEYGYAFEANATPLTTLRGADYNLIFDRALIYNKPYLAEYFARTGSRGGEYINWLSFAKGTLDTTIINKVFTDYVDLPEGFNFTDHVTSVGSVATEVPWVLPTAGSTLRKVMQSISQVTNAVWWIDANKCLWYTNRTAVTAPYPITDGLGGITAREVSLTSDMSQLVTEDWLWGTLARTTSGDIMVSHHEHPESLATYGHWQWGEERTEIHHASWLSKRAGSIISRYGLPLHRANVTIYDPGYMAGMVANVKLDAHGLNENLVIREMTLDFAVGKEPVGETYYGLPRYRLTMGLDPETPWTIYDYLPYPEEETGTTKKSDVPYRRFWVSQPVGGVIIDDFENRPSLTDAWGTASSGLEYGWAWVSGATSMTFSNGYMHLTADAGNTTSAHAWLEHDSFSEIYNYPTQMLNEGIFSFRFRTNAVRTNLNEEETYIEMRNTVWDASGDSNWGIRIYISNHADHPSEHGHVLVSGSYNPYAGVKIVKNDWLANTWYVFELGQFGDRVFGRVYEDGGSIPDWQVSQSVSGPSYPLTFGEYEYALFEISYLETSAIFYAATLDIDDIRFDGVDTGCVTDAFPRTVAAGGGWGSSPWAGKTYQFYSGVGEEYGSSDPDGSYVNGSSAVLVTGGLGHDNEVMLIGAGPWSIGEDFTFACKFKIPSIDGSGSYHLTWGLGFDSEPVYAYVDRFLGTWHLGVAGNTYDEVVLSALSSGTWYEFKWEHTPSADVSRAKFWASGSSEPDWMVSRNSLTNDYYLDNTDEFSLWGATPTDQEIHFDSWTFCSPAAEQNVVIDGWNTETLVVTNNLFTTSAKITPYTMSVSDQNGRYLYPMTDWKYDDNTGYNFWVKDGVTSVTVRYLTLSPFLNVNRPTPRSPRGGHRGMRPI